MATNSAYQALQDKVVADNKLITDLTAKVSALQSDSAINGLRAILAKVGPGNSWIDGGTIAGNYWTGADAQLANSTAQAQIAAQDKLVSLAQTALADAKKQLITDTKAVTDYETNSPTLKAQLANDKTAQTQKLVVAIIALVIIVGTIIIIVRTKKKKNKTT